ncbi:acyl-coenzyme A diphosphatase FITM2 [Diorhabda sublineata]|uniref:acyl-coenzyme A diphosphatase FITM2 n=1 Tax=Diorhabda sublineata TaxID=1163346 RepID=UPI0024E15B86|nr:acyl-coenzyme A diphosphatase FITM2 [Diorhabda sublineata]
MVSKRRSIHATNLNFRPNINACNNSEPKGTKPTSEPTSVKEILVLMVMYLCKKSLFFDTNLKVGIYLSCLFVISLIADVLMIPKTYLSRSDNVLNKVFVKFAWGWNLTLIVPFIILTSVTYCCGNKQKILKNHMPRILIATFFWWFWTSLFNFVEASLGRCANKDFDSKILCLREGHVWNGFDLSGHSFILIYGSLFLIEETRCIVNWDAIKDYIRLEEYQRQTRDSNGKPNPLRNLTDSELKEVKTNYEKFTPYIRLLFVLVAVIQILWDVMLISTMLYYHIMIEKFLGGAFAILTWFFTYRVWYTKQSLLPRLPGDGTFKYIKRTPVQSTPVRSRRKDSLTDQGPLFMGMPIYANYKPEELSVR